MRNIYTKLQIWLGKSGSTGTLYRKKTTSFIGKRPFASFLITLGLLFALIVAGNILRRPPAQPPEKKPEPKKVSVFRVGDSPRVSVQATVEKTGVITIVAQTPGIVQEIYIPEGGRVAHGGTIVWLSANYQGGNPASIGRQIAVRNAQFSNDTYDIQKDLLSKQRDAANKTNTQAEELREIARKSFDESRNLINATTEIVSAVDRQIAVLRESNASGANDEAISQLTQSKLVAQGSLTQLNAQLRQSEYTNNEDRAPAQLGDASREIALRQLELQEQSTDLQRDVANLNVKLSRVSEAMYFPASPGAGVVERVYINVGDSVLPGDKIATIRADRNAVVATALVDQNVASRYARAEASIATFDDGSSTELTASYIPTEATDGTLSAIKFAIPQQYANKVTNNGYVSVALPLGASASSGYTVYVPLDAIYQTQESSYIFVARRAHGSAYTVRTQEVTLGDVSGSFVRVLKGARAGDVIIVSRFVQDGDTVTF